MAGFDLGSIIAQASQLSGTQAQQAQQVADLNNQSAALAEGAAFNISTAGNLQSQAQLVKLQGELQTQKASLTAANAFGTNVNDVSDIITQIGQGMRTVGIQLNQAQAEVADIEANSDIITNPAGWFKDLLQGDAARAKRDALAGQFDTLQKTGAALNQQTQATVQTQNAISQTLTEASAKQAADATKAIADAEAAKMAITGKQYGAQAIEAMRQVGADDFNRSMQVYNQITEDQRYKEGYALRTAQFQALQDQRAKIKIEDDEYTAATNRVNEYRTRAGLPAATEGFVRRTLTQGGDLGDDIRRQERLGMNLLGGTSKVFGESPAETIAVLQKDQPNLPDSYAPAISVLQQSGEVARQELDKMALAPGGEAIRKDPQAAAKILNQSVTATAKNLQSNVQTGKGNPYEAPAISVILAEPNGIKDTKYGRTVLATLAATGQDNPTPDMLLASSIAAVDAGEITFAEAVEGSRQFYANAVSVNNTTKGFLELGVLTQEGYNTRISALSRGYGGIAVDTLGTLAVGGGLSGLLLSGQITEGQGQAKAAARTLDLTKSTDVTLAMTVMKSRKLAEDIAKRTPQ